MKNRVIAVDFDGTLCENKWPQIGAPRKAIIKRVLDAKADGAKIIPWTCREGELLQQAVDAAASWGIGFDAINDSLPSWKDAWNSNPRKIGASEYWDDRAVSIPEFGALPGEVDDYDR
jgi:hypothetical protein